MAGSITFGARTPTSTDVALDGEANSASVKVNGRFDGDTKGWRSGHAELTATIDAADGAKITALLIPPAGSAHSGGTVPGRVLLKAVGVPAKGLATLTSIETGEVKLGFRGQLVAGERSNKLAGKLDIVANDGGPVAALAGISPPVKIDGMPLSGSVGLSAEGGAISLDPLALKIGGSRLSGRIEIEPLGERRRVDASLDVDELELNRLLAPLLDQRLAVTAVAEAAISGRKSPWPDEPFDAAALDRFEGKIQLTSKRLMITDDLGLQKARLEILLESGKADVTQIEGLALGGQWKGALRIAKLPAGAEISGSIRLAGGDLEALPRTGDATPPLTGRVDGELKFSGKGTSPRNAVAALQGSGKIELADAKLPTLWTGAIGMAVDAALKAEADKLRTVLKEGLAAGLSGGHLPLPATVQIEIADGHLRIKPFAIENSEGVATGGALLDLSTLAFDSEWRLENKLAAGKRRLPAILVSYQGSLAALDQLNRRINADGLERELSVRRMERDVEELERLRKLDEARRRDEAERLRRQLDQVAPAPAPVPAPAPAPPAGPARPATPG
jgi:uncharacterized protein involved in outer membrane biogenesis